MTSVINEHSHGLAPVQMRSERKRSTNIDDFAPIAKTEEQWRYLDVERLLGLDAALLPAFTGKLTFSAPAGASHSVVGIDHKAFGSAGTPEDRVAAAAWGAGGQAQLISVPANFSSTEPVRLEITGESLTPSGLHIVIEAGAFAEATIVVDHRGQAALAENIEIIAGDESKLKIVSVQDWTRDSAHVSAQYIKLGRNAQLEHVVVTLGGDTVRVTPTVAYSAPGGDVNLLGAYFATAGQHFEHRPFVDHSQPNCKSNVTYKGALQGEKAHTVWVGDVLIRKAAEGTDTYELNRNLLLTDGARADSVPNLEIETGEIEGAGHASASGRFDDEQLFYLQARGIPELDARRLVVRGFLNEVIQHISVEDIEERLSATIETELARSIN
jgi:Fe-S cluster assembly protein SufD